MSTFLQILPMANADPSQGEQNTAGFSDEPKNLPGLFEKMMTQVLSTPSLNSASHKEENQSSQTPVQSNQVPANFSSEMPGHPGISLHAAHIFNSAETVYGNLPIQSKSAALNQTNSKATTQASGVSNKDKKSEASVGSAGTPTGLETFFAVPVLTVEPIGTSGGEKAPKGSGSAASSQAGAAEPGAVLPAPARANSVSTTTTKVPPPQLSANQLAPTIEANAAVQQLDASGTKETALFAKNSEVTLPQVTPTAAMLLKSSDVELPESQTAIGLASPNHENTTTRVSDSSTSTVAQPQPDANGTSIAKQDMTMNQAEKTNKIAGQTEKVLPGSIVSASRGNLPSEISLNTQSLMATAGSLATGNINGVLPPAPDTAAVSAATDTRANTLERTQDLVTVSAMRLSDSGNSSMQVVIKPDAGTQLSLELRQQGGSMQVQAVLQQGDFNHLNQQWPDLQQRLEERGIRLAPLTDEGAPGGSNSGSETFQDKQNQTNEVVPELTLVDAPAGMFTHEPAQTSAHRGWETWA